MVDTKEVIHKNYSPLKILLQKTSVGYNWEIHYNGTSLEEILPVIREADQKMKREYGGA
ncbi:MAG: hypothetical protein HPY61_09255 [Methanotrichaceae archaeon]|nr:hypothetical protein [Methanotrichaceae archaeon]